MEETAVPPFATSRHTLSTLSYITLIFSTAQGFHTNYCCSMTDQNSYFTDIILIFWFMENGLPSLLSFAGSRHNTVLLLQFARRRVLF